jgi:hypothetical protein
MRQRFVSVYKISFFIALLVLVGRGLFAADFTSSSFIVRDPVIISGSGYSASASFQYFGSLGQTAIGASSGGGFIERSGFLYFSVVTNPVLSGTTGDAQASLTWTASSASLGHTVTAYEVGQSTVSGSGYTYTNVGNVLASVRSGLTNSNTYYFIIRTLDSLGDVIATSNEISVTPAASGGGGGGGGSSSGTATDGIIFSGYAFPESTVTILKDGVLILETIAGGDARFSVRLSNLATGSYNFAVYGTDRDGIRSNSFSFPITIEEGDSATVSGIFIAPTIEVDKAEVRKGDDLVIFGQTTPDSEVTIEVNSETQNFAETTSNDDGVYLYNFNTAPLEMGGHDTKSKSLLENGQSSGYGKEVAFVVGTQNIPKVPGTDSCRSDLNTDSKVNLVDFSIAAFWYKKSLSGDIVTKELECLNGDSIINLVDFSIMAFYWTG